MKITLIMDPNDIRCKQIEKACKNNKVKFNLIQYDYGKDIVKWYKKAINNIWDWLIFHSNIWLKRENWDIKDNRIWESLSLFAKKEIIDKSLFCVNKRWLERRIWFKYNQYIHLKSLWKKYLIPTFLYEDKNEILKWIKEWEIKYPFIMKVSWWRRWKNVHLIDKKNIKKMCEWKKIWSYIFQNFIKNDWDFRVLMLWEKVLWIIKRYNKDSYLNNISTGWKWFAIKDPKEIEKISKIAKDVSKAFKSDFAWIDIIYDKEKNKYLFLEINNFSQRWWFNSVYKDIDVADLIVKYIIKKILIAKKNKWKK